MKYIRKYFPEFTETQIGQFEALGDLYNEWNAKINVISRKDMEHFYERHVLHSLGIHKVQAFRTGARILDAGTGGGFPGIPLAIANPQTEFLLVDSIGKKIKVVNEVAHAAGIKNVQAIHSRVESIDGEFDFVVSRAVTRLAEFIPWVEKKIMKNNFHKLSNGILYLKGGDLQQEIRESGYKAREFPLSEYFQGEFFESKKVVYVRI